MGRRRQEKMIAAAFAHTVGDYNMSQASGWSVA